MMKRNIIISALLLTFVYLTGAEADEKTRMAISEFQGGIQQRVILTDLLIEFATSYTTNYQIVIADNSIRNAISRFQSEMEVGIIPKQNDFDSERVSAELFLIPKADRFENTYVLTANILDLRTFEVIERQSIVRKGNSEILLELVKELWFKIEPLGGKSSSTQARDDQEVIFMAKESHLNASERDALVKIKADELIDVPVPSFYKLAVLSGQVTDKELQDFIESALSSIDLFIIDERDFPEEQKRRKLESLRHEIHVFEEEEKESNFPEEYLRIHLMHLKQELEEEKKDFTGDRNSITVKGGDVCICRTGKKAVFDYARKQIKEVLVSIKESFTRKPQSQSLEHLKITIRGTGRFFDIEGLVGVHDRTWVVFDLR